MLSNVYFLAKFRFDTAENEPAKMFAKFANFANPNPKKSGLGRRLRLRRLRLLRRLLRGLLLLLLLLLLLCGLRRRLGREKGFAEVLPTICPLGCK